MEFCGSSRMGQDTVPNPNPATTLVLPFLTHDLDSRLARRGRHPCQPGSRVFCRRKDRLLPEATADQPEGGGRGARQGGHLQSVFLGGGALRTKPHPHTGHCLGVLPPPWLRRPISRMGGQAGFGRGPVRSKRESRCGQLFMGCRGVPKANDLGPAGAGGWDWME